MFYKDFTYKNLEFVLTCNACPEQYDVFDLQNNKTQVGYVRLRWGTLRCTVPDVGGDSIYAYSFDDEEYKGCFSSEDEREKHLKEIAEAILERLHG